MKQTTVDWLYEQIKFTNKEAYNDELFEQFQQAKEMEKQQIIDAFDEGKSDGYKTAREWDEMVIFSNSDHYYNETYGSKGSDDHIVDTNEMVEKSDKPFLIHGEHQIQMLELSDEEIRKAAIEYANNVYDKNDFKDEWRGVLNDFIAATKWYREQLKQRQ